MVRHLLEDHLAPGAPRAACDRHSDLRRDVEQLPRLDHLYDLAEHAEHPARACSIPRPISKPVEPHHGRIGARDPPDSDRLYRRAALLRPGHRDHRDEIAALRATFDQAAALYDRDRRGYPQEWVDDLAELA